MFYYSFSTVMMAVIASNLIIALIALCFRHKKLLLSVGYKLLIAFLFLTSIRFLFPLELKFTTTIQLPKFLSVIVACFRHVLVSPFGIPVSMWTVFECVWVAGIAHRIYCYTRESIFAERFLTQYGKDITGQEPYGTALSEACRGHRNPFRILKVPGLFMPCLYGIRRPRILLPANMNLTGVDLYYTMCHEASHYYHHDLILKQLINLLSILYWWNPACAILKEQVNLLLEMRVDDTLVKDDPKVTRAYLQTLIDIAESSAESSSLPVGLTVSLMCKNTSVLSQRFEMICCRKNHTNLPVALLLFTAIISIYAGSYIVTFESYYTPENIEEESDSAEDAILTCPAALLPVQASSPGAGTAQPRHDIIQWRFKTVGNTLYRRLYNYSTANWIGEWEFAGHISS